MRLDEAIVRVQRVLDDMTGMCYVASEAIYHLAGGKDSGLKPMCMPAPEGEWKCHWFLQDARGMIVDVTYEQFSCDLDYSQARGKGFLTKEPSKRARQLIWQAGGTVSHGSHKPS